MYTDNDRSAGMREYRLARKAARKNFHAMVAKGENGYLPSLESVIKRYQILGEQSLGTFEIPLKKIVGTYEYSRSISFSQSFLPLLDENTEFSEKWSSLYAAHINEGIRDPIKAYEFMNWIYVAEGNKRVSILKHLQAYSISGHVTRLLPKKDPNNDTIVKYYRFLEFYKKTKIHMIWLSDEKDYAKLESMLDNYRETEFGAGKESQDFVNSLYLPFRKHFHEFGGGQLNLTTGDAFLIFLTKHGFPKSVYDKSFRNLVRELVINLTPHSQVEVFPWRTIAMDIPKKVVSGISGLLPHSPVLQVGMVYPTTIAAMEWNSPFEAARRHILEALSQSVNIHLYESVPDTSSSQPFLEKSIHQGLDMLITTSYGYWDSLTQLSKTYADRCQLVCCEYLIGDASFRLMGQSFQPRFLCGMVAGMMTLSNQIGFVATVPHPDAYQNINAFALGVQTVNPDARVSLVWTNSSYDPFREHMEAVKLIKEHVDVLTHHQCTSEVLKAAESYGVYGLGYGMDGRVFAPKSCLTSTVWHWNMYYERLIKHWASKKALSIETPGWGIADGVVGLSSLSPLVLPAGQRLIHMLYQDIESGRFQVFGGPIYDQQGNLRVAKGDLIDPKALGKMNWLMDNVDTPRGDL